MFKDSPKLGKIPTFHTQAVVGLAPAWRGLWPGGHVGHSCQDLVTQPSELGTKHLSLCARSKKAVISLHPAVSCEFTHQLCGNDLINDQFYLLSKQSSSFLQDVALDDLVRSLPTSVLWLSSIFFLNIKVSSVNVLELCALLACAVGFPGHFAFWAQALRDGHVATPAGQKKGVTQLGAASFASQDTKIR